MSPKRKRILLVEDEIEMRQLYEDILSEDYEVDTAKDGVEGLCSLLSNHYDLVLLDILMPNLNGLGVLKIKSKASQISHIPVVLLTNKDEEESSKKCLKLGIKYKIIKEEVLPYQLQLIIQKELHAMRDNSDV